MKNRKEILNFSTTSWPKASLAHAHRVRSVCRGSATASNRPGNAAHNWPGRPQDVGHVCARRGTLGPGRAQSACRGTTGGGSPMAKPWQGVHRKLPQPTVHSPDMIESPSSQEGRQAMGGGACGGSAGWLWWSREVDHAPESCSEVGGCSRTYRGRKGAEAVASLPTDGEAHGMDKMHGEGPFYSCVGGGWMGWTGWLGLGS
jgi:hypothetical protein